MTNSPTFACRHCSDSLNPVDAVPCSVLASQFSNPYIAHESTLFSHALHTLCAYSARVRHALTSRSTAGVQAAAYQHGCDCLLYAWHAPCFCALWRWIPYFDWYVYGCSYQARETSLPLALSYSKRARTCGPTRVSACVLVSA